MGWDGVIVERAAVGIAVSSLLSLSLDDDDDCSIIIVSTSTTPPL